MNEKVCIKEDIEGDRNIKLNISFHFQTDIPIHEDKIAIINSPNQLPSALLSIAFWPKIEEKKPRRKLELKFDVR